MVSQCQKEKTGAHNQPNRMRPAKQFNLESRHLRDYALVIKEEQNWPGLKITDFRLNLYQFLTRFCSFSIACLKVSLLGKNTTKWKYLHFEPQCLTFHKMLPRTAGARTKWPKPREISDNSNKSRLIEI